jgi:cephalosporin hydroxylase
VRRYSLASLLVSCVLTAVVTVWIVTWHQARRPRRALLGGDAVLAPLPRPEPMDMADPRARAAVRERYERMVQHADAVLSAEERGAIRHLFNGARLPFALWWLGVPVIKSPNDLWMMQQIMAEVRPDYVVEAGTYLGGSALWFADVMDALELPPESKVITIDIEDMASRAARFDVWRRRVEFIHGSSTGPEVVARIAERVRGRKVIVALDSDHSRDHVLAELRAYAPLVSPGSYLVVEDTELDGSPGLPLGPMAASRDFLASPEGAAFQRDRSREAYIYTLHPGGWLKKAD